MKPYGRGGAGNDRGRRFHGASIRGIKILVVDDDAQARSGLLELLEECGAKVSAVASASLARAAMAQWTPDVVISDLEMPGESGQSLMARLRASGATMPAIAVTGYDHPGRRVEALRSGYDIFLTKPVPPARLVLTIFHLTRGNVTDLPGHSASEGNAKPARARPDPDDLSDRHDRRRQGPDSMHLSPRRRTPRKT